MLLGSIVPPDIRDKLSVINYATIQTAQRPVGTPAALCIRPMSGRGAALHHPPVCGPSVRSVCSSVRSVPPDESLSKSSFPTPTPPALGRPGRGSVTRGRAYSLRRTAGRLRRAACYSATDPLPVHTHRERGGDGGRQDSCRQAS